MVKMITRIVPALVAVPAVAISSAHAGPPADEVSARVGMSGGAAVTHARPSDTFEQPVARVRRDPPAALAVLGDSYSSGLGVGDYDDECDRTNGAWGMLAFEDEVPPERRSLVACSGATVPDVYDQLDKLDEYNGPGTRLITLTVGGNDIGFADELARCFIPLVSCTGRESALEERIGQLRGDLVELYTEVQQAAPEDVLIVGGYPLLVPDPDVRHRCRALTPLLSTEERQMIRRLGAQLNDTIDDAAATTGVSSLGPVLEELFDGHEACDNGPQDWLHGLRLSWPLQEDLTGPELDAEPGPDSQDQDAQTRWSTIGTFVRDSFHPNVRGQAGYAEAVTLVWSQPR